MSDVFTFDLKGMDQLKARFTRVALRGLQGSEAHLKNFADNIMEDSKARFVPIDSGDLINTGRVDSVESEHGNLSVRLAFGGGRVSPYAIAVHEHLSEFSPPSWQHTTVNFRRGGPKFLELPVMEHSRELPMVAGQIFLQLFTGQRAL